MRRYLNNTGKRIFSAFLCISLLTVTFITALFPVTDITVYAAQSNKTTISGLCTGGIGKPSTSGGGWSYVYYGKYGGTAMKYRVLDTAATQFNAEKTMLLDCDSTITNRRYHPAQDSISWDGSEIKSWLNGNEFYGDWDHTDVFTRQEQAAIASSTKAAADGGDGKGWYNDENDSDLVIYAPLTGEHIFFLDAKEATRPTYGYTNNNDGADANRVKSGSVWWLRSVAKPGVYYFAGHAGYVKADGGISQDPGEKNYGVSPAFNLKLKSVIFSSLIPDKTNEFKLTVKDDKMTIAKKDGSDVTRAGNVVTVPYKISGTNDEKATQVSVLLTDEEYSAGVAATEGFSYLKLNVASWDTSGTGTFTLPADYANKTCGEDYFAYILAETVNDGTATDYASAPASITIPRASGGGSGSDSNPSSKSGKSGNDDEGYEEGFKTATVNPDTIDGMFLVNGKPLPDVAMGKMKQGIAAQAAFNVSRPAGWIEAFTFNMAIDRKVEHTLKNGVLIIIIPKEYQKTGRTFAIMGLDKKGKAWIYPDTDTNPATVTANVNFEGYAFALIYKD